MRPNDRNIMYKHPIDIDIEGAASPAPSSPPWNSDSNMFWGLNQRIEGTEKQTRELSSQSDHQMRLIQAITKSQNQREREQREAMSSLLSRIEQNETSISGLQHATQSLSLNQRQTQQDVRILREELMVLKEQVKVQQQQQRRDTVLRRPVTVTTQASQRDEIPSGTSEAKVLQLGAIFKDVYGRRRRLCRYCGENLDAAYCMRHERNKVCRRGSYCSSRNGSEKACTSSSTYALK